MRCQVRRRSGGSDRRQWQQAAPPRQLVGQQRLARLARLPAAPRSLEAPTWRAGALFGRRRRARRAGAGPRAVAAQSVLLGREADTIAACTRASGCLFRRPAGPSPHATSGRTGAAHLPLTALPVICRTAQRDRQRPRPPTLPRLCNAPSGAPSDLAAPHKRHRSRPAAPAAVQGTPAAPGHLQHLAAYAVRPAGPPSARGRGPGDRWRRQEGPCGRCALVASRPWPLFHLQALGCVLPPCASGPATCLWPDALHRHRCRPPR